MGPRAAEGRAGHGPCVSESPPVRAERLLAEAAALAATSHWRNGAEKILLHKKLVECLSDLQAYHEGHAQEHQRLVTLVAEMLEALHVSASNGSQPPWWHQIPGPHSKLVSAIKRLRQWFTEE